jgi:hypothetical protein
MLLLAEAALRAELERLADVTTEASDKSDKRQVAL